MRSLRVLAAGALTTVQDDGRRGLAHLGVPRSGWLDAGAARLANLLVGNETSAGARECAVLECLGGGLRVEVSADVVMAVTGAACAVRVGGRPAALREPVRVRAGEELALGPAVHGVRCYVAVSGGLAVTPVLGSRSTDTLSRLGPPALAEGDLLPLGPPSGSVAGADGSLAGRRVGAVELRVTPGPRADWFAGGLGALLASSYAVGGAADRVGVRLEGPALDRVPERLDAELPSEGVVLGAVQVPADGRPLVFLRDHPTTGGYPVVAVVDEGDLDRCAQLAPGDEVRFRRG